MNEDMMIALGDDAEALLKSNHFNNVINALVESTFQTFVNTSPEDVSARERCYASYRAFVDVTNTLRQQISVRDEINAKNEEANNTGNNNQED